MLQRSRDARQRQSGFTLIELLIVVVVLGVLAAVVLIAVGAFNDRGELAACRVDVKSVEVAVDAYRAKEGRYPESLDDLTTAPGDYLRELPNTTEGSGDYWIVYDAESGTVGGRLATDELCAGEFVMGSSSPSPTSTPTTPGGGGPGGGNPTTTSTSPGGGNPTTTSTSPGGGNPTTTTTSPGGGNPTTTTTNPNPNPTPGQPGRPSVTCFNPPGLDILDCAVSWAAPAGPVTRYDWQYVLRFSGACDFGWVWLLGGSGTSTTNSSTIDRLVPLADYCVRVRAVNGNSVGPWSPVASFNASYWPWPH